MFESTFFSGIVDALNPFKILGTIRNSIKPTLNFIDWQLGYEDFEICYGGRPEDKDIEDKKVYFYKEKGKIYCLTKDIISSYKDVKNPSKELEELLKYGLHLSEDYIGKNLLSEFYKVFENPDKKLDLSIEAKDNLYKFLIDNKVTVGLKYTWHSKLVKAYNKFEANFIEKHPLIYKSYLFTKKSINNICTFAVSQTGIRIASVASAIAMTIASGGTLPAILAGAYVASIGVSLSQQAYSRMNLNALHEEADLLVRYEKNNVLLKQNGYKIPSFSKEPIEIPQKGTIRKWTGAAFKHLSTYFCEAAVPIATAFLCPVGGIFSLTNFGIFVGMAAIGVATGISVRKAHEDIKEELKTQISKAREKVEIPNYKNLNNLKKLVIAQEESLMVEGLHTGIPSSDPTLQSKSFFKRYWQGLKDVINPFKNYMEVKNPKAFAQTVSSVGLTLTSAAVAASGNPYLFVPALATAAVVGAANVKMQKINSNPKPYMVKNIKNNMDTSKSKEHKKVKSLTTKKEVGKKPLFTEIVKQKADAHPLERTYER